jgi:hypothetical protein
MILRDNNNLDKNNSNNNGDNNCKDKQQHNICIQKKLDTIDDKINCLQQLVVNLHKEFLSNNKNSKISQINYNNRGWRE